MARKKTNLVPIAVEYIKEKILSYELKPGTVISDNKIATEMTNALDVAISRSPVREALLVLQAEGFVEVINEKNCVARISAEDIVEICQVRNAIEQQSVLIVNHKGGFSDEQKERFSFLLSMMLEKKKEKDAQAAFSVDDEFHMYLVECSGNGRLYSIAQKMRNQMQRVRWLNMVYPDMNNQSSEEHRDILAGIMENDAARAISAVNHHNEETSKRFQSIFDSDILKRVVAFLGDN